MSDHLTSLVLRAVQPARIHRRMRSRFESDPPIAAGLEIISGNVAHSAEATARPDMQTVIPTPPPYDSASPNAPPHREQRDTPSPDPPKATMAPQAPGPPMILSQSTASRRQEPTPHPHQPALSVPVEPVRQQSAATGGRIERAVHEYRELRQERVERSETLQQTLEQTVERLVLLEPRLHRNALPQRSAPPASTPAPVQAETPMPAPQVEVSIGRIEVLPLPSSPVRTQHDDAPRPPAAQSLETYLRRRSGSNGREDSTP